MKRRMDSPRFVTDRRLIDVVWSAVDARGLDNANRLPRSHCPHHMAQCDGSIRWDTPSGDTAAGQLACARLTGGLGPLADLWPQSHGGCRDGRRGACPVLPPEWRVR